jgi:hypothetical protein
MRQRCRPLYGEQYGNKKCPTCMATLQCAGIPTLAANVFKQYVTPCPLFLAATIRLIPSAYYHIHFPSVWGLKAESRTVPLTATTEMNMSCIINCDKITHSILLFL